MTRSSGGRICGNCSKQEIVRAMVQLAGSINSIIIAEGVETREEYEMLRRLEVPYGQGYLFGKPADCLLDRISLPE